MKQPRSVLDLRHCEVVFLTYPTSANRAHEENGDKTIRPPEKALAHLFSPQCKSLPKLTKFRERYRIKTINAGRLDNGSVMVVHRDSCGDAAFLPSGGVDMLSARVLLRITEAPLIGRIRDPEG